MVGEQPELESAVSPERDLDTETPTQTATPVTELESAVSPERDLDMIATLITYTVIRVGIGR